MMILTPRQINIRHAWFSTHYNLWREKVKKAPLGRWNEQKSHSFSHVCRGPIIKLCVHQQQKNLLGRVYRRRMAAVCGLAKSNASFEFYQIQNDTIS